MSGGTEIAAGTYTLRLWVYEIQPGKLISADAFRFDLQGGPAR